MLFPFIGVKLKLGWLRFMMAHEVLDITKLHNSNRITKNLEKTTRLVFYYFCSLVWFSVLDQIRILTRRNPNHNWVWVRQTTSIVSSRKNTLVILKFNQCKWVCWSTTLLFVNQIKWTKRRKHLWCRDSLTLVARFWKGRNHLTIIAFDHPSYFLSEF